MKIVFLCGGMEPGLDGVGDYICRLSAELIKQGHIILAIALNDRHVKTIVKEENRLGTSGFTSLRIPSDWKSKKRFEHAKEHVDSFNPEWISLQFVPYGFNNKGLPFNLGANLKNIGGHRKWHIMFHELYIEDLDGLKDVLISRLQKYIIRRLIYTLNPKIAHTHLPFYYRILKKWMNNILVLPLFSNIPFIDEKVQNSNHDGLYRIAFFSQITAEEQMLKFLSDLKNLIFKNHGEIEIIVIGGKAMRNIEVKQILEDYLDLPGGVTFTGFLDPREISNILRTCKLGVTPVPRHVLGKSGSVAAFITHGIPVAAPVFRVNPTEVGFLTDELCSAIITEPDFNQIEAARNAANLASDKIMPFRIANTLLSDLNSVK